MIVRVEGQINGQDLIFSLDGNKWKATVPRSEDGEYITSLHAYDDYGNSSYLATILFEVKGYQMRASLIQHGYISNLEESELLKSILNNQNDSH